MGRVADHEIYVFSPDESINDYDSMGLVGALIPTNCVFRENANGESSLELTHPLDFYGRYQALITGNILVAPVPVRSTPEIKDGRVVTTVYTAVIKPINQLSSKDQRTLYKNKAPVTKKGKTTDTKIKVLPAGHELVIVADYGDPAPVRWKVKSAKYGTGWINPDGINVQETVLIDDNAQSIDEVQSPWSVRPQYFRIIEETRTLTEIKVRANHIRYDLLKNMTRFYSPKAISLKSALSKILEETYDDHWFSFNTNIANERAGLDYRRNNLVDVFLNPEEGICKKYNAALISDNYDLYFLHDPGRNRGIFIEYGKNMLGIDFVIDEDSVITHVVPVGETRDGEALTLGMKVTYKKLTKKEKEQAKKEGRSTDPTELIEYDTPDKDMVASENAKNYPIAHIYELRCEDCKVHDEEEGGGKITVNVVKARMREQANALFEEGIDQPRFTLTVDYINLGEAEEYKQFYALEAAFLWDYLIIRHKDLGIDVSARIIGIEWDVLTGKMLKTEVGQVGKNLANQGIANWQIPNGFPGWKIGYGSIPGTSIQTGTISANHIQANSITAGHIQAGSIVTEHLEADIIQAGHIQAGSIVTEHLTAGLIDAEHINAGSINAGHIQADTINAGHIQADAINAGHIQSDTIEARHIKAGVLEAEIANIDLANIITANIETANIDWASILEANIVWADISSLNTQVANIVNAQIANAQIDFAQIVNLVAGTALITQGVSGKYVIKDLDVTENLTAVQIEVGDLLVTGNLILTGSDGNIYTFSLDESGSTVTPVVTQFTGENLADRTIGANKLIANSITANELNVSSIFANEAFLLALTAHTVTAGELIANEVFTGEIITGIISNPEAVNIIAGAGISLAVSNELSGIAREFVGKNLSLSFSKGVILGRDNTKTHVKATVRVNGIDITDKIPAQCFIWERTTPERVQNSSYSFTWNPTSLDIDWGEKHTGLKEFDITTDDIFYTAVVRCRVDISLGLPAVGIQNGTLLQINEKAPPTDQFGIQALEMTSSSPDYFISLDSIAFDNGFLVVRYRDIVPDPIEVTMTDRTDDPYDAEVRAQIQVTDGRITAEASRIDSLTGRMSAAELKITPDAITSTVTTSTAYGNDKVYVGATAPANPVLNKLWVDVSVPTTPQYKRWDGSKWVVVTDAALTTRVSTSETKIEQTANSITSQATQITAINNTLTSHNTRITQNATDISLRATTTTVNGINTRLQAAEQSITPTAITSTISSQLNGSGNITTSIMAFNNAGLTIKHSNLGSIETRLSADGMRIFNGSTLIGGLYKPYSDENPTLAAGTLFNVNSNASIIDIGSTASSVWNETTGTGLRFRQYSGRRVLGGLYGGVYDFATSSPFMLFTSPSIRIEATSGSSTIAVSGIAMTSLRQVEVDADTSIYIRAGSYIYTQSNIRPLQASDVLGGTQYRWDGIYLTTAPNVSSDKRLKTNVLPLTNMSAFVQALKPVSYQRLDGKRTHFGLIAQEVKEAMNYAGILDFAGYSREMKSDPETKEELPYDEFASEDQVVYSLRYEEFIAPLIAVVQEQEQKINDLTIKMEALLRKGGA